MLVSNRRRFHSRSHSLGAAVFVAVVSACASTTSPGSDGNGSSSGDNGSNPTGSTSGGGYSSGAGASSGSDSTGSTSNGSPGSTSSSSGSGNASGAGTSTGGATSGSGGSGASSGASSSGGASSGTATSSSSGSSGTADSGPPCAATVATGAIALSDNYVASSVVGSGGYAFAYSDKMGSTACIDSTALCATGSTAIANSAGTIWGAGVGFNLNQAMGTATNGNPAIDTLAATGTGVAYSLSNLPSQGMRVIINDGGTDYCSPISAASGNVSWGAFNTKCWDNTGTYLTGAPSTATHIEFQVTSDAATTPFDFCVTSVAFATSSTSSSSSGGSTSSGSSSSSGSGSSSGGSPGCTWSSGPSTGSGELTCYWFGQGTSTGGGCSSYKTYCGYCGSETGSGGGTCPTGIRDSISNVSTGSYFAAFPIGSFGQGSYCGMCVDVSYQGKTITATIVDECATCTNSNSHIDLSLGAAAALGVGQGGSTGDPTNGVTWKAVACPVTGDIVAVYNGSSSQIYFQNVAFPVASASAGGNTASQSNGFWNFNNLVGGKSVALKDTLGHQITGTLPTSSGQSIGAQFPQTCN